MLKQEVDLETKKLIMNFVADKVWRVVKFCNSDEEKIKLTWKVLDELDLEVPDDMKTSWVYSYKSTVNTALNAKRSYVQSEMKKKI